MKIKTVIAEWETGDVVGGALNVPARERCYYRRDSEGSWIPFPDDPDNEQWARTDNEITSFVEGGTLIIYPAQERP